MGFGNPCLSLASCGKEGQVNYWIQNPFLSWFDMPCGTCRTAITEINVEQRLLVMELLQVLHYLPIHRLDIRLKIFQELTISINHEFIEIPGDGVVTHSIL